MTADEQKRLLKRLGLLVNMTMSQGCTEHEEAVAQQKIGAAVQQHHLTLSFGPGQTAHAQQTRNGWERRAYAQSYTAVDDYEYGDVTVIGETEKAVLIVDENGDHFWMPKSQLRGKCRDWAEGAVGTLYTSAWWARKEGWPDAE